MNIMFCGDSHAEDGILIATLSLLKNTSAPLHLYILTMQAEGYEAFDEQAFNLIKKIIKEKDPNNTAELIDCTELFKKEPPRANMETRFTPYAMLRLFADQIPQIPDRILYLDDDIIVRKDISDFYNQDLTNVELVGVLDFWGRFFIQNLHSHKTFDYLNSGVLLLNMNEIKKTRLFAKVREKMSDKKMLLPDQSALNKLATEKRIAPRCYNEQYRLHSDTKIQHFTTSFRFKPYFHTLTVKPWDVERVHSVLKLHEYDDLLKQYTELKPLLKQR